MKAVIVIAGVLVLAFVHGCLAQDLPSKIRGYKVHTTDISVRHSDDKMPANGNREAVVAIGVPDVADYGLKGITLSVTGEIASMDQSGRIDFITFHDFKVNGIKVEIEEYHHAFTFKKGEPTRLPKPVRVFVGTLNLARAALNELLDRKKKWTVTGNVLAFGKYKKFGMHFKRVIPVRVDLAIPNPLN